MRRVLVTGATGFLGRPLVAALTDAGYGVRAAVRRSPDRPFPGGVEVAVHGDLAGSVDWRPLVQGMDAIVHLAGIAHANDLIEDGRYDLVNRAASATLAESAARGGVGHLVFVSSIRAQSGPTSTRLITEAEDPKPTDAYGRSKLAAEAVIRASAVPATILRPVLVAGIGAKGNLQALRRLARLPIPLPFASFANRRSLLALDDFNAAVRCVLENPATRGETYIVAHPQPISIANMIVALRKGLGRRPWLVRLPTALIRLPLLGLGKQALWERLGGELVVDPSKLMAGGWQPRVTPEAALSNVLAQAVGANALD
jgi:UDP-glucose 4-epimerase